jgi:hypothetical protein
MGWMVGSVRLLAVVTVAGFSAAPPDRALATVSVRSSQAAAERYTVLVGNFRGPPAKFQPPRPSSLQRAPEGTAQKLLSGGTSKAIQRELWRRRAEEKARAIREYCRNNPHRPNCGR